MPPAAPPCAGMSLGMVMQLPDAADEHSISRAQLSAKLDVAMGGRVAEELIFGERDVTTGASSDLEQVRGCVALFACCVIRRASAHVQAAVQHSAVLCASPGGPQRHRVMALAKHA
jgi:Peptidase family M41